MTTCFLSRLQVNLKIIYLVQIISWIPTNSNVKTNLLQIFTEVIVAICSDKKNHCSYKQINDINDYYPKVACCSITFKKNNT